MSKIKVALVGVETARQRWFKEFIQAPVFAFAESCS
jgi:hypothetical protein